MPHQPDTDTPPAAGTEEWAAVRAHINKVAPYPTRIEQVTAAALRKDSLVGGLVTYVMSQAIPYTDDLTSPSSRERMHLIVQSTNGWIIAALLLALEQHAPAVADKIAQDLWRDLEAGDMTPRWLWQHTLNAGIDPADIRHLVDAAAAAQEVQVELRDHGR